MVKWVMTGRLVLAKLLVIKVWAVLVVVPDNAVIREAITEELVLAGQATEHLVQDLNMERQEVVELNSGQEVKPVKRILATMGVLVLVQLEDSAAEEEDLKITELLELVEDILEEAVGHIQIVREVGVDHIVQELVAQEAQGGIRQVNMDL